MFLVLPMRTALYKWSQLLLLLYEINFQSIGAATYKVQDTIFVRIELAGGTTSKFVPNDPRQSAGVSMSERDSEESVY